MNRFASTRSEVLDSQPVPGRAQCSVGSIDDDGIRYGFTTHALIASTIAIAPAIVTIQSIVIRQPRGRLRVRRSIGFREWLGAYFGDPKPSRRSRSSGPGPGPKAAP